jgi:hypothetical protein
MEAGLNRGAVGCGMKRLLLFNPENDIALGMGLARFTPPRQAALLHRAGAMLPAWLGEAGDFVLVQAEDLAAALQWRTAIQQQYGIQLPMPISTYNAIQQQSVVQLPMPVSSADKGCQQQLPMPIAAGGALDCGIGEVEPFGWSLDTIAQFERAGVPEALLQRKRTEMERHRNLSHRRSALKLLQYLDNHGFGTDRPGFGAEKQGFDSDKHGLGADRRGLGAGGRRRGMPVEARSLAEVEAAVGEWGEAYVKSPWSSSGRGVFPTTRETLAVSADRIQGIIKRQGSVMVEPLLPKLQDFAMLFDRGEFAGYSLFFNSTATNYAGNFVASDARILEKLSQWIPAAEVEALRKAVAAGLAEVLGDEFFNGKLGVDMMVCGTATETPWIAPCVEINLRATMGFVARGVYRKLGREGVMTITPNIAGQTPPAGINLIPENPWFSARFCEQV